MRILIALIALLAAGCSSTAAPVSAGQPGPAAPQTAAPSAALGALVFASGGNLVRTDRLGQNPVQLTSTFQDSDPYFHPHGLNLVFCRRPLAGGKQDVFTISPDGSNAVDLTRNFPHDAFAPIYSPDGSFIAFSARVSPQDADLYVMNADGSNLRLLTSGAEVDIRPAISPDGRSVVFERETTPGKSRLCKVSLEEGQVQDLTSGLFDDSHPSYVPPDNTLVFTRDGTIMLMSDTGQPDRLSLLTPATQAGFLRPSFGKDVMFFQAASGLTAREKKRNGGGDIFRMELDGSPTIQLTQGAQAQGLAVGPAAPAGPPPDQVTVEVVNDSGLDDSQVFLLLETPDPLHKDGVPDQSVQGPPTLLTSSGAAGSSATAEALSGLTPTGQSLRSPYTGKLLPIYSFKVNNLTSGRFLFSYNKPVSITKGAAPTASEKYRYDKLELTYEGGKGVGGGNLTAIDFFGIPAQVEVSHWGQDVTDPLQTKGYYASTPTLLKEISKLGSMKPAVQDVSGNTGTIDPANPDASAFPPNAGPTSFARLLSPGGLSASNKGLTVPYPGFDAYLSSLVGQTFNLNGGQYGGYRYKATVASDGAGGYVINCSGTTTDASQFDPRLPQNADVTVKLPKNGTSASGDPIGMDFFIYATVANKDSYSVAGFPFVDDAPPGTLKAQDKVNLANASPYGALLGDLQASLNFGYPGGKFGFKDGSGVVDLDSLYNSTVLPYPYPFGGARAVNDGYYNAYAGIFYYLSDAYGHPYSDRLAAASPLYSLRKGDTVRITLLNDNRLDTPLVSVTDQTSDSLALSWPAIAGATGYEVSAFPAVQAPTLSNSDPVTCKLTGLQPGTPYLIEVSAVAGERESGVLPVQGVTGGARIPLNQEGIKFQVGFGAPDFLNSPEAGGLKRLEYRVNGTLVDAYPPPPGQPLKTAFINGALGPNLFGVEVKDPTTGEMVYQGNYVVTAVKADESHFDLDTRDPDPNPTGSCSGNTFLQYNLTPLTAQPNPPYPNVNPPYVMVIGTPFNPKPFYRFFEVVAPR